MLHEGYQYKLHQNFWEIYYLIRFKLSSLHLKKFQFLSFETEEQSSISTE